MESKLLVLLSVESRGKGRLVKSFIVYILNLWDTWNLKA
jgi:hypothetical protein